MFGDDLSAPKAGQPITEGFLRQLVAIAKASAGAGGAVYVDGTGVYPRRANAASGLRIQCTTEAVPRGGVGYTTGIVTGKNSPPVLAVAKLDVLGRRPLFVAETGGAQDVVHPAADLSDVVQVLYHVADGTPAVGETWGPVVGQWTVRKRHHGFLVVEAGDADTELVRVIYDPTTPWYDGKMDAAMGSRETKAVSLYYDDGGSGVDLGLNVDALAPLMLSSGSIAIGKWVRVMYDALAKRWTIASYEC